MEESLHTLTDPSTTFFNYFIPLVPGHVIQQGTLASPSVDLLPEHHYGYAAVPALSNIAGWADVGPTERLVGERFPAA
jgi:hypothetical protein